MGACVSLDEKNREFHSFSESQMENPPELDSNQIENQSWKPDSHGYLRMKKGFKKQRKSTAQLQKLAKTLTYLSAGTCIDANELVTSLSVNTRRESHITAQNRHYNLDLLTVSPLPSLSQMGPITPLPTSTITTVEINPQPSYNAPIELQQSPLLMVPSPETTAEPVTILSPPPQKFTALKPYKMRDDGTEGPLRIGVSTPPHSPSHSCDDLTTDVAAAPAAVMSTDDGMKRLINDVLYRESSVGSEGMNNGCWHDTDRGMKALSAAVVAIPPQ